jgi:hypothetical protein
LIDAATGELMVRHRPNEHVMKLRGADKARVSIWRQDHSPIVLRVKGFLD